MTEAPAGVSRATQVKQHHDTETSSNVVEALPQLDLNHGGGGVHLNRASLGRVVFNRVLLAYWTQCARLDGHTYLQLSNSLGQRCVCTCVLPMSPTLLNGLCKYTGSREKQDRPGVCCHGDGQVHKTSNTHISSYCWETYISHVFQDVHRSTSISES